MTTDAPAVALANVNKRFGATQAVRDLSLTVPRGGLYGLIGPNGAGKTTTIRMIMAILFPDSGELSVLGQASALEAKDRIGYLPEERGVYRKMRVDAFLQFMARLKGVPGDLHRLALASLERVELAHVARKRCEELSKGMLQKVQFMAAVIHRPDLLILDEPFSGLDPLSTRLLRDLILEEHRRGATILFSTHVMPQAEEICQNVIMIHRGEKVLDDSLASIRSQYDPRSILFEPRDPAADLSRIASLPLVAGLQRTERGYELRLTDGVDPASAMRLLLDHVSPARMELARPSLEDVFLQLVEAGAAAAPVPLDSPEPTDHAAVPA
jgi:ABC-2 type transport system ATP-binding protein